MDLGSLRSLLAAWAERQALVRRLHVVGPHARGAQQAGSTLEVVIELDARTDWKDDAVAIGRWQGQLASALPMPVHIAVFLPNEPAPLRAALRAANICVYERTFDWLAGDAR